MWPEAMNDITFSVFRVRTIVRKPACVRISNFKARNGSWSLNVEEELQIIAQIGGKSV
jgi:hypothetical protein